MNTSYELFEIYYLAFNFILIELLFNIVENMSVNTSYEFFEIYYIQNSISSTK